VSEDQSVSHKRGIHIAFPARKDNDRTRSRTRDLLYKLPKYQVIRPDSTNLISVSAATEAGKRNILRERMRGIMQLPLNLTFAMLREGQNYSVLI
jgi:hypothetical protein